MLKQNLILIAEEPRLSLDKFTVEHPKIHAQYISAQTGQHLRHASGGRIVDLVPGIE